MKNNVLWHALDSIARKARQSGKAKKRSSHKLIANMIFMILGAWALGMEQEMHDGIKNLSTEIELTWEKKLDL